MIVVRWRRLSYLACCLLFVSFHFIMVAWLMFDGVLSMLCVVRCALFVVCCYSVLLWFDCCMLCVVYRVSSLVVCRWLLDVVDCSCHRLVCVVGVCCLLVGCCVLLVVGCRCVLRHICCVLLVVVCSWWFALVCWLRLFVVVVSCSFVVC